MAVGASPVGRVIEKGGANVAERKKQKRKNGDGSFRRLKNGTVEYTVSVGGANGVSKPKRFYGPTESEARKAYQDWLRNDPATISADNTTLVQLAEYWLATYKEDKVSGGNYRNYEIYIRQHIALYFRNLKPAQIDAEMIEQFFKDKGELSGSALNYLRIILKSTFKLAVKKKLTLENPLEDFKLPQKPEKEIQVFPRSSARAILKFSRSDYFGLAIMLLLYTGLRLGELCALKWSDLDFEEGLIRVRAAISKDKFGRYCYVETTKGKRTRVVPFHAALLEELKKAPKGKPDEFVLHNADGSFLTVNQFESKYKLFFRRLNADRKEPIEYKSPHKCRHSFATYTLKGSENIMAVKDMLGHKSLRTTQRYVHVDLEDEKKAVKKLSY